MRMFVAEAQTQGLVGVALVERYGSDRLASFGASSARSDNEADGSRMTDPSAPWHVENSLSLKLKIE